MYKIGPLLIVFLLIFSCTQEKKSVSEISDIEIATGYCHGECPFSAMRVNDKLTINYYGGDFASKKGYFIGKISQSLWDSLTTLLVDINYQKLAPVYNKTKDDQAIEIIITANGVKKHVVAQEESLPKGVRNAFYEIAMIYKKVVLKPVANSIKFNTKVQYMPKLIGKPKFPPASK